jgi:hypothetical protein
MMQTNVCVERIALTKMVVNMEKKNPIRFEPERPENGIATLLIMGLFVGGIAFGIRFEPYHTIWWVIMVAAICSVAGTFLTFIFIILYEMLAKQLSKDFPSGNSLMTITVKVLIFLVIFGLGIVVSKVTGLWSSYHLW